MLQRIRPPASGTLTRTMRRMYSHTQHYRWLLPLLLIATTWGAPLRAQQRTDYHESTTHLVARGSQALAICNGVFVSHRTLEQIYAGELRAAGGQPLSLERVEIDRTRRAVAVGIHGEPPVMRAVFREGLGCVAMAPEQTFADIDALPVLRTPPLRGDPATVPWPDGDLLPQKPHAVDVDSAALERAGDWAFERTKHGGSANQVTLSLLVVHRGDIIYERYAPGITMETRTRTWSSAKSIAGTLIGIAVDRGLLELDAPLPIEWPPDELDEMNRRVASRMPMISVGEWPQPDYTQAPDPRRRITLRHVLNMSSGLYPVDNRYNDVIGSGLSYFAGWSSAHGAADRGLVREPGTVWDYENYDTLLGMLALRSVLADSAAYLEFPRVALLDRIGMRNTLAGVDRFGDFVMSSQVYTNARDLARLGLLYLNRGVWNGERILSESWVDFSRSAAPATARFGNFYGGQWWLVPDARADLPQDAYTTAGAQGQYAIVVPSRDLVVVRRGLDGSGPGFPTWDLLARVLEALPSGPQVDKPLARGGLTRR